MVLVQFGSSIAAEYTTRDIQSTWNSMHTLQKNPKRRRHDTGSHNNTSSNSACGSSNSGPPQLTPEDIDVWGTVFKSRENFINLHMS